MKKIKFAAAVAGAAFVVGMPGAAQAACKVSSNNRNGTIQNQDYLWVIDQPSQASKAGNNMPGIKARYPRHYTNVAYAGSAIVVEPDAGNRLEYLMVGGAHAWAEPGKKTKLPANVIGMGCYVTKK